MELAQIGPRIARRIRLVRSARTAQVVFFFLLSALLAALFVDRLAWEISWQGGWLSTPVRQTLAGLGVVGISLAASIAVFLVPVDPRRALLEFERRAGAEQELSTAYDLAIRGKGAAVAEAIARRAVAILLRNPVSKIFPLPFTTHLKLAAVILATGSLLYAFPPTLPPRPRAEFRVEPAEGVAPLTVLAVSESFGWIERTEWEWGDGARASGDLLQHSFASPGVYRVRMHVQGPGGSDSAERLVTVHPDTDPVARLDAAPLRGIAPLAVRFRNLSENAERIEWEFPGERTETMDPVRIFDQPGKHVVRLRAFRGSKTSVASATIEVFPRNLPQPDFVADPIRGEPPLEVQFEDRSRGRIESWEWDFGDPFAAAPSPERNPAHTYRLPGVYTVRLTVRGPDGEASETKERYIRVGKGGGGGGGSGGSDVRAPAPPAQAPSENAGSGTRDPFGDPSKPPPTKTYPESVRPLEKEGPLVEKEKDVYVPADRRSGGQGPPRFEDLLVEYERQMEEWIRRDRLPDGARRLVQEYLRRLRGP